ncbi:MAG TPA: DoxX family protein [Dongiaceae bacterium]|nr:DoxX family protein [Dongiaceae bacterium]
MTPAFVSTLLRVPSLRLVARVALTCAFWWGALTKLTDFPSAIAEAQHFGLEPAALVVVATIIVQLGGSLLLIFDRWAWLAAGALGIFTLFATLIAHDFWNVTDAMQRFRALNTFLEHLGLIGGLFLAAALSERERIQP